LSELHVIARCKIHEGKLEAFRAAAAGCLRSVQEQDTGTNQYDWFLNEDQTEAVVLEKYRDSDAVLEHIANLGANFGALLETCDLSLEIFGDPSPELREAASGLPSQVYAYFQGGKGT
jgi:quinol monooxygenase YgiN